MSLTLLAFGVASCGRFQGEQRAAWRDEAEAACMARGEAPLSSYVSLRGSPISGPGTCGMNKPLRVNAFAGGAVGVTSTQTLACPIVAVTDRFLAQVVQPAAMGVLGTQIIEMRAGSYSCRAMNNGTGTTRRSEHSFGNALDIFAFRTADGREITVRHGWNGSPEEQAFLREVFVGACQHYRTVLGPGADMFHYDHFHVDLARHNGGRSICRPIIKYTPRRDLPPPDPARGWTALNPERQAPFAARSAAAAQPQTPRATPAPDLLRGPIRLPGAVQGGEEIVVGDVEGEMIDPDVDPFAAEAPPLPPTRGRAAPSSWETLRWTPGPAPAAPAPAREWPPRF